MKRSGCSIYDGLIGAIVGDYMGLPYAGKSRKHLASLSVLKPEGFGSYGKVGGTWGTPGALLLATTASLARCHLHINYGDLMDSFAAWILDGAFTPDRDPLPGSSAVSEAVDRYRAGFPALSCGSSGLRDNGNGALVRMLPLAYLSVDQETIGKVAGLTHARLQSRLSCLIYVSFARSLLESRSSLQIESDRTATRERDFTAAKHSISVLLDRLRHSTEASQLMRTGYFDRLLEIDREEAAGISSTAYVIDSLEAALWSFLTTTSYRACILQAVSLGYDTNSTASLAGGLAGIYYGADDIPAEWLSACQDLDAITGLADKFDQAGHGH